MPVIGPRMAVDLAIPTGVDSGKVLAFQMRSGKTAQEVIAEAAAVIGTVNEELNARYGGLVYFTPLDHAIYAQGQGARKTPKKTEGRQPDPVRGDIIGHMLPIGDYEDAVAWTPIYLRDAWDAMITADLRVIADSWRYRFATDVLTRMFSDAENKIGDGGWDVPWAIGTGKNVNFIPPQYATNSFDSTHTHFKFVNSALSATSADTALANAVKDLKHHGITGRLVAMVSEADVATYAGISKKFVKFVPQGITPVAGNSNAPVLVAQRELEGMPGEIFGFYLSDEGPVVELRAHELIPTTYGWVGKSYGTNNPKNPLAVREHPAVGFGLRPDPQVTSSLVPELDKVIFKATHGVGVNDRLNGVAFQINASSYSAPSF